MSRDALIPNLIPKLVALVDRLNAQGDIWGGGEAEIAHIALRRWSSFARRHPKVKHPTVDDRVLDLAKGLQSHFEPDIPYTPRSDWRALAGALAEVLKTVAD